MDGTAPLIIIRKHEVQRRTGRSEATVRRLEKYGCFPARVQIGENVTGWAIGWFESDINEWLRQRSRGIKSYRPPTQPKEPVKRKRARLD